MSDAEEPDNIIHLPIDYQRGVFETGVRPSFDGKDCMHFGIAINRGTRKVWCRDCDAELDPLECLVQLAKARKGDEYDRRSFNKEIAELETKAGALRKEEARLRKSARDAAAENPVEQFKIELLDRIAKGVDAMLSWKTVPAPTLIVAGDAVMVRENDERENTERTIDRMLKQLDAAAWVVDSLLSPERSRHDPLEHYQLGLHGAGPREQYRRKIAAAIEELEARRRRLKIQVVKGKRA